MLSQRLSSISSGIGIVFLFLASVPALAAPPPILVREKLCDGSAAAVVDDRFVAVADDEENMIAIYRRGESGPPVAMRDMSDSLGLSDEHREVDIEAAAKQGGLVYWIGSHGTNKEGKKRHNRRRLFATTIEQLPGANFKIELAGHPYSNLVEDLSLDPRLAKYDFANAARRPSKDAAALNIEGLSAAPDGGLLIGFRCPVVDGKALVLPLKNPKAMIESREKAILGAPIELDLAGRGIRDMVFDPPTGIYWILAGPTGKQGTFAIYTWSGPAGPPPVPAHGIDLGTLRPEALAVFPVTRDGFLVLSDDGELDTDATACKDRPRDERSFRSVWMPFPR